MLLSELMDERGWSADDVAARLAEHEVTFRRGARAGEQVDAEYIGRRGSSPVPKIWSDALGVAYEEASPTNPGGAGAAPDDQAASKGRREQAPKRPKEAAIQVVEAGAGKRIAGAYKFAGAALAAGSGSQGVAIVWSDQSDAIADLWLEAAKENPWAARFVNMMQAGGVTGDLAAAHLYLAGATLYVLGAGIPGGDAIFAKYSAHRPVVKPPAARPAGPAAGANGSAAAGDEPRVESPAEGAVAHSPV